MLVTVLQTTGPAGAPHRVVKSGVRKKLLLLSLKLAGKIIGPSMTHSEDSEKSIVHIKVRIFNIVSLSYSGFILGPFSDCFGL